MSKSKQIVSFDTNFCDLRTNDRIVFNTKNNILPSKKYIELELISLEMCLSFFNVRSENRSNILAVTINGTLYEITITSINYTRIEDLIVEINAKLFAILPNTVSMTLAISSPSYLLQFSLSPSIITCVFNSTPLIVNILGFSLSTPIISNKITGTLPYNLNHENYLGMNILQAVDSSQFNNPLVLGQFKIPLLASFGSILFYSQSFYNNIIKSNVAFNINDIMSICFYDRYGCKLPMQNLEFSFSFMFTE